MPRRAQVNCRSYVVLTPLQAAAAAEDTDDEDMYDIVTGTHGGATEEEYLSVNGVACDPYLVIYLH